MATESPTLLNHNVVVVQGREQRRGGTHFNAAFAEGTRLGIIVLAWRVGALLPRHRRFLLSIVGVRKHASVRGGRNSAVRSRGDDGGTRLPVHPSQCRAGIGEEGVVVASFAAIAAIARQVLDRGLRVGRLEAQLLDGFDLALDRSDFLRGGHLTIAKFRWPLEASGRGVAPDPAEVGVAEAILGRHVAVIGHRARRQHLTPNARHERAAQQRRFDQSVPRHLTPPWQ